MSKRTRKILQWVRYVLLFIGSVTVIILMALGAGFVTQIVTDRAIPTPTPMGVSEAQAQLNPLDIITIKNVSQLNARRSALTQNIFGTETLDYTRVPDDVEMNVIDPTYAQIKAVKQVNQFTIRMDFGLESRVSHLIADQPKADLIIYAYGHDGITKEDLGNIIYFVENHYSVLAVSMPLIPPNNQPTVESDFGPIVLTHHFLLSYLQPNIERGETLTPRSNILYVFAEPILASLNLIGKDYKQIFMVGMSGGGWTTMLYSALDSRVLRSYPVAGGLPMYLKQSDVSLWSPNLSDDIGDFEQWYLPLHLRFDYLDLFVMAASGEGRGQLQVFNLYDVCCFAGTRALHYEEAVRSTVQALGAGEFRIYTTPSHAHEITDGALDEILKDIENS